MPHEGFGGTEIGSGRRRGHHPLDQAGQAVKAIGNGSEIVVGQSNLGRLREGGRGQAGGLARGSPQAPYQVASRAERASPKHRHPSADGGQYLYRLQRKSASL